MGAVKHYGHSVHLRYSERIKQLLHFSTIYCVSCGKGLGYCLEIATNLLRAERRVATRRLSSKQV